MNEEKAGMALLAYRIDSKAKKRDEEKSYVMTKVQPAQNMQQS